MEKSTSYDTEKSTFDPHLLIMDLVQTVDKKTELCDRKSILWYRRNYLLSKSMKALTNHLVSMMIYKEIFLNLEGKKDRMNEA
ncbi:hypothetical protein CEXT_118661 [Caerostris extrusa]|uniref:Uncharacterized protein n=1 Tax=Caerostris extrusa TaxID=172846 RepID=A0AAV4VRW1_CAEEX|nr:hypothetical protein CEXT_118661 [Caerostris extrusa]